MKKSAQVVMLPTKEKAVIGFLTQKGKERGHLVHFDRPMPIILDSENQHLYFLSDEEIKEGDYFIYPELKEKDIWLCRGSIPNVGAKKIIATTDTSFIYLPQPSQSFIEHFVSEYNKDNMITEVMVEYKSMNTTIVNRTYNDFEPKINTDNTINISMPKDSWSRKEVIELIQKYSKECTGWPWFETDEKWIEENL